MYNGSAVSSRSFVHDRRTRRRENVDPLDLALAGPGPDLSTLTDEEFNRRLRSMRREHARTMSKCSDAALNGYVETHAGQPYNPFGAHDTYIPTRKIRLPSPPDHGDTRYNISGSSRKNQAPPGYSALSFKSGSNKTNPEWANGGLQLVPTQGRRRGAPLDEGMSAEARRQRAATQARREEVLHVMQAPFSFEERERLRKMDREFMRRKHEALVAGDWLWPDTNFKVSRCVEYS